MSILIYAKCKGIPSVNVSIVCRNKSAQMKRVMLVVRELLLCQSQPPGWNTNSKGAETSGAQEKRREEDRWSLWDRGLGTWGFSCFWHCYRLLLLTFSTLYYVGLPAYRENIFIKHPRTKMSVLLYAIFVPTSAVLPLSRVDALQIRAERWQWNHLYSKAMEKKKNNFNSQSQRT